MAGANRPGPQCEYNVPEDVEDGTMCRAESPLPGPVGVIEGQPWPSAAAPLTSPVYTSTVEVLFSIAPQLTWDGFQRAAYDKLNAALQEQANTLLRRGNITYQEMENLVNARNSSLLRIRDRLTSFGEMYSEILKPGASLRGAEQLLREKGSMEAVLESVGNTRQVVDRIGIVSRIGGPVTIILEISIASVVIAQAPPREKGRVAAKQVGGSFFGVLGGSGGLWAGCAGGAALVSWSLVIPYVGEGAAGTGCLVGGLLGGLGIGFAARKGGERIGEGAYQFITELHWTK